MDESGKSYKKMKTSRRMFQWTSGKYAAALVMLSIIVVLLTISMAFSIAVFVLDSKPDKPATATTSVVQGSTPLRQSDFPLTIVTPGEYVLMEDVVVGKNGITIAADQVDIDLGGHTISSRPLSDGDVVLRVTSNAFSVKHGEISGMGNGTCLYVYNPSKKLELLNIWGLKIQNCSVNVNVTNVDNVYIDLSNITSASTGGRPVSPITQQVSETIGLNMYLYKINGLFVSNCEVSYDQGVSFLMETNGAVISNTRIIPGALAGIHVASGTNISFVDCLFYIDDSGDNTNLVQVGSANPIYPSLLEGGYPHVRDVSFTRCQFAVDVAAPGFDGVYVLNAERAAFIDCEFYASLVPYVDPTPANNYIGAPLRLTAYTDPVYGNLAAHNVSVFDCMFTHSSSAGIIVDNGAYNVRIERSYIRNIFDYGVSGMISAGITTNGNNVVITNNDIARVYVGIQIGSLADQTYVTTNTVINATHVHLLQDDGATGTYVNGNIFA